MEGDVADRDTALLTLLAPTLTSLHRCLRALLNCTACQAGQQLLPSGLSSCTHEHVTCSCCWCCCVVRVRVSAYSRSAYLHTRSLLCFASCGCGVCLLQLLPYTALMIRATELLDALGVQHQGRTDAFFCCCCCCCVVGES